MDADRTFIAEVRGYKDGAKTSDLGRLARFSDLYRLETGDLPSGRWYVVNQFMGDDPGTRPMPLVGTPDDVAVFGELGGLVIDTRDLLRLWLAVEDNLVTASEARGMLNGATGVFQYPA